MAGGELSGDDKVLDLVAEIYDAALDATRWPNLMNEIGDAVGGPRVMFGFYDGATGLTEIHAPRYDPDVVQGCVDWAPYNPLPGLSASERPGKVFTCADFLRLHELTTTAFYQEWLRPAATPPHPPPTTPPLHAPPPLNCHNRP